jgi:hypothetical protein
MLTKYSRLNALMETRKEARRDIRDFPLACRLARNRLLRQLCSLGPFTSAGQRVVAVGRGSLRGRRARPETNYGKLR